LELCIVSPKFRGSRKLPVRHLIAAIPRQIGYDGGFRPFAGIRKRIRLCKFGGRGAMTDILSSSSNFLVWLCMFLASRRPLGLSIRMAMFVPLTALMIGQLLFPIEIEVRASVAHPINGVLRLASLGLALAFLFGQRAEIFHRGGPSGS